MRQSLPQIEGIIIQPSIFGIVCGNVKKRGNYAIFLPHQLGGKLVSGP
jgi:hypothetical protein